jgi:hypothetical protein
MIGPKGKPPVARPQDAHQGRLRAGFAPGLKVSGSEDSQLPESKQVVPTENNRKFISSGLK